jgi:hypothetical protein
MTPNDTKALLLMLDTRLDAKDKTFIANVYTKLAT